MRYKKLIVTAFLLYFVNILSAQKGRPIDPSPEVINGDWEIWQEQVPISGNVRVGLMFEGVIENPEEFYAYIPKKEDIPNYIAIDKLCAEISSIDGRYSAKIYYNLKAFDTLLSFNFPSKYSKALSKYKADELVILASLTDNCKKSEIYAITSWNKPVMNKNDTVNVYVNSISVLKPKVVVDGESKSECTCTLLKSKAVAYNKKCAVTNINLDILKAINVVKRSQRGGSIKFINYKFLIRK